MSKSEFYLQYTSLKLHSCEKYTNIQKLANIIYILF